MTPRRTARRPRRHRVSPSALGSTRPAFAEVLSSGRPTRTTRAVGWLLPLLAVGALALLLSSPPPARARPPRPKLVTASLLRPPPPPPPPVQEPPPPPRPRRPRAPEPPPAADVSPDPGPEPEVAPEQAAQAGQVVAQAEEAPAYSAEEFSLMVGAGLSHVGGLTSSVGRSDTPVKAGGGGKGKGLRSRAREAWPQRVDWSCAWPAGVENVDRVVTMRVRVSADGKVEQVEVLKAATPELKRVVEECALTERFLPARDEEGRPHASTTRPLTIRFLMQ